MLAAAAVAAASTLVFGTATRAEAATLFSDDFQDGDAAGWSGSGGTWTVVTDDGTLALRQSYGSSENAYLLAGSPTWRSYTVQARVKPITFAVDSFIGLLARAGSPAKFYRLALLPGNQVRLEAVNGNSVTLLASASYTIDTLTWYTIAIEVNGTTIRGTIDGNVLVQATNSLSTTGQIGLQTVFSTASFDDVTVTS